MFSKLTPGNITKSTAIIASGWLIGYGATEIMWGDETFYSQRVMPMVHRFVDGETSHKWAVRSVAWGLLPKFGWNKKEYDELRCEMLGLKLKNPIGLAAGFDKNGEAIVNLARDSGFGFIEVGSVTPVPQTGNPKPRVFRLLEDEAVVNRYGFNSDGVDRVEQRTKQAREQWTDDMCVFGINLGKNKFTEDAKLDYEIGVNHLAGHCDYLVVNVSSPNTPGLRSMQKRSDLEDLMAYVDKALTARNLPQRPKVFLKIAPDLVESEMKDIAQVALNKKFGIDGLIVSNTTIARADSLQSEFKNEVGGLSGAPLRNASTECVRKMYRFTSGKVVIIGCGGIGSGQDAYDKIRAGASAVQLYTALVYQGFPVVGKVKRELVELLRKDGFSNVTEAVGVDSK